MGFIRILPSSAPEVRERLMGRSGRFDTSFSATFSSWPLGCSEFSSDQESCSPWAACSHCGGPSRNLAEEHLLPGGWRSEYSGSTIDSPDLPPVSQLEWFFSCSGRGSRAPSLS